MDQDTLTIIERDSTAWSLSHAETFIAGAKRGYELGYEAGYAQGHEDQMKMRIADAMERKETH